MDIVAAEVLLAQMRARTHVAPKRLVEPGPDAHALNLIFNAASHAPDHGRLQPWHFIRVAHDKRTALGDAFAQALSDRDHTATQSQKDAAYEKAFRAPCLMMAVIHHAPCDAKVPTNDRLIALGCAIQNMMLMAQALSIGSGITSGQSMNAWPLRRLFQLKETEEGICFLSFGTIASHKEPWQRAEVSTFVKTLSSV
jgi:nitroreductase